MKKLTIRMPDDIWQKLRRIAFEHEESINATLVRMTTKECEKEMKKLDKE